MLSNYSPFFFHDTLKLAADHSSKLAAEKAREKWYRSPPKEANSNSASSARLLNCSGNKHRTLCPFSFKISPMARFHISSCSYRRQNDLHLLKFIPSTCNTQHYSCPHFRFSRSSSFSSKRSSSDKSSASGRIEVLGRCILANSFSISYSCHSLDSML